MMGNHINGGQGAPSWIDQELAGCQFADVRLEKRFKTLVNQLSEGFGDTIPMACQDWAATKAAYRFLSNERVSEPHSCMRIGCFR